MTFFDFYWSCIICTTSFDSNRVLSRVIQGELQNKLLAQIDITHFLIVNWQLGENITLCSW